MDGARRVARELAGETGQGAVEVVDSRSATMGLGFVVLAAVWVASAGGAYADVLAAAHAAIGRTSVLHALDTLEHARRGGRLSAAQAVVGAALSVKPIVHLVDGTLEPLERVRTGARALQRLEDLAVARAAGGRVDVAVHHLVAEARGAARRAAAGAARGAAGMSAGQRGRSRRWCAPRPRVGRGGRPQALSAPSPKGVPGCRARPRSRHRRVVPAPMPPDDRAGLPSSAWSALQTALRERLPPSLRGGRLALGRGAVLGLGLVAALGISVAAVLLLRGSPHALVPGAGAGALPGEGESSGAPGSSAPSPGFAGRGQSAAAVASPRATIEVVVDVEGRVRHPGVLHLPMGARVVDALVAAGGALPGTDLAGVSRARRLVDGEQLRVGLPPLAGGASSPATVAGSARPAASASAAPGAPLDLNAATEADLDGLPGVGPVLAQRIIDWREAHGGFRRVEDLRSVSGLGGKRFDTVAPLVTLG